MNNTFMSNICVLASINSQMSP